MKLRIGDRVKINKDCCKYNITPYGTIIGISASGWSDIGGIYKLLLDNEDRFNCSEDAIEGVVGHMEVITNPWSYYCNRCVHCVQDDMCSAYRLGMSWCYCPQIRNCTKFWEKSK